MAKTARVATTAEGLGFLLLVAAFYAIQIMIGGTRMVFSLPSYGLLGVLGVLALFSLRPPKPSPSSLCLGVTTIFLGYILARAWFSPVPYIARADIYSVLGGLIVYFYTACILTNARERMFFLLALLVLAMGHVFIGALQFRDATNFMPISWLKRFDYEWRASGFYICPNHLAGLLEVLAVFGLSMICWSRWPGWAKLLLAWSVAACYAGVVLTGSRGGYLSTGVSLLVFGVLSLAVLRRRNRRLFWSGSAASIVAALLLGLFITSSVRTSQVLSRRARDTFDVANMRLDLWQGALQQWRLQPIIGTGAGTYLYYGRLFRTERVQQDPVHTHNDYLHLLAEYGLAGAVGMALFLGVHLARGLRGFARFGPRRVLVSKRLQSNALALNIGALAAVASYLAHSVVDFNLHIPGNLLLTAFAFGLLANGGAVRGGEPVASAPHDWFWRLALPLLGAAAIVQVVRLLPGEYASERARMAVRDGRGALGIMYARRGLKSDPQNPDLHNRLGRARMLLGREMDEAQARASFYGEGIAALQRAHALAPQDEIYVLQLARALDDAQRFEEAEALYHKAMQLDPRSTSLPRYYEYHLKLWRDSGSPAEEGPQGGS